jgi:hypothetical protein
MVTYSTILGRLKFKCLKGSSLIRYRNTNPTMVIITVRQTLRRAKIASFDQDVVVESTECDAVSMNTR